jgi:hypothetical protein
MLGNNENDLKVDMGGAQQQQQAPAGVVYVTAQPAAQGVQAPVWGGAQAAPVTATPVTATPVPSQQPQPQVVYVQAPPMVVAGRYVGGACACGGSGTIVTQQVSGTQILSFVLLLIFFWPLCWLPFCMDQCCECAARATPPLPRPRLTPRSCLGDAAPQTPRRSAALAAAGSSRCRKGTAERSEGEAEPCRPARVSLAVSPGRDGG